MRRLGHTPWLWPLAIGCGAALGAASIYPYYYVAGPGHVLGNSAAIWLLFAFGIGSVAARPLRGATAGVLLLLTTVVTFFAISHVLYSGEHVARVTLFWIGTALVGGPVFGLLGATWRGGDPVWQGIAAALMGSAFVSEAIAFQAGEGPERFTEIVVGLGLTALLAAGRRQRLVALSAFPVCLVAGLLGWALWKRYVSLTFQ